MLTHVFSSEIKGHENNLFDNCHTLDLFLMRVMSMNGGVQTKDLISHAMQSLAEGIIQYQGLLNPYEVITNADKDILVHGKGLNKDGQPAAVVALYVENPYTPITDGNCGLNTFLVNAMSHYGIKNGKDTFLVFSNAMMVHENTLKQFITGLNLQNSVKFYLKADIEKIINDNAAFWTFYRSKMERNEVVTVVEKTMLRAHQIKQLKACCKDSRGIVLSPTGTGKSLTEAAVIEHEILKGKNPVCVLATPRILLTGQLIRNVFGYLKERSIQAQFVNLNSGSFEADELKREMDRYGQEIRDIPSTTSPKELEEYYAMSRQQNVPMIIGATYQSVWKLNETDIKINVLINDEAHNLVSCIGRFSTKAKEKVREMKADRTYFFTATAAYTVSPEGSGMQNEKIFGKQIATWSPKEAIEAGEIVPPFIHIARIDLCKFLKGKILVDDEDIENNIEVAATMVVDGFLQHRTEVKAHSCSPDKLGAKMLVVCKGEPSFAGLLKSELLQQLKADIPGLKIFGISTASGAYIDGYIEMKNGFKELFMKSLRNMKDDEDAIIFHIDMIGEGIDVPGITGIMAFRELGAIKSSQTLGRAMRLCVEDRKNLYNGTIKPMEFKKMIKPYAWIVIPMCSVNEADMWERMKQLARDMRENLGYLPFEFASAEGMRGTKGELFTKETNEYAKTPDELRISHEIDDPEFLMLAGDLIDKAMKGDRKVQKLISQYVSGIKVADATT